MHAARLSLSLLVTLGAVVAATTTAGATAEGGGGRVHQAPPVKKPPPPPVKKPPPPGIRIVHQGGLIVPAPALPPQAVLIVPEVTFADARGYPIGMLLEAPPIVHRRIVIVTAVVDRAPPLDLLPPYALALAGLGVIGLAFAGVRRRGGGSLAHPLGSL